MRKTFDCLSQELHQEGMRVDSTSADLMTDEENTMWESKAMGMASANASRCLLQKREEFFIKRWR